MEKESVMRKFVVVMISVLLFSCLFAVPGKAGILGVSNIYVEPTGYEDPSTHEWKGSFWVIAATTDTKESYLFYRFNETTSASYGQNKVGNNTIIPTATIKITITPRQPYWEKALTNETWMVYPKTYGTYLNYILKQWGSNKIEGTYIPALYAKVLCSSVDDLWTKYTPFDVTVEKIGDKAFSQTVTIDTSGGADQIVLRNPVDASEKIMINNLGQLGKGYDTQPPIGNLVIFKEGTKRVAFEKTTDLERATKYGRDLSTGAVIQDENYAFYWFGGGTRYLAPSTREEVRYYFDDKSPAHAVYKSLGIEYASLVEDSDFPGSYRSDGPNFWDKRALPVAASIWEDNQSTNPSPGLSLISYLKDVYGEVDLNSYWNQGWDTTSDNRLRVSMPYGATSSLITIRISTELADSVVYQPVVGCGKCEQAFWDSTKTTSSTISDNDTAILKIKQYASASSKITVTPSIPSGIPASVTPSADSAIVDSNSVHTFQFKITNLGTETNQTSAVTFTVSNDLGTVTDTKTLGFELIAHHENPTNPQPSPNPQPAPGSSLEGDPMWMWLVAVVVLVVVTVSGYTVYSYHESRKKKSEAPKV